MATQEQIRKAEEALLDVEGCWAPPTAAQLHAIIDSVLADSRPAGPLDEDGTVMADT